MNKAEFLEAKKEYESERERFSAIRPGDIVFEVVGRGWDSDYHPAIVKSVNVDKTYITVIDVTRENSEHQYHGFMTSSEYIKDQGKGSEKILDDLRREYSGLIETLKIPGKSVKSA